MRVCKYNKSNREDNNRGFNLYILIIAGCAVIILMMAIYIVNLLSEKKASIGDSVTTIVTEPPHTPLPTPAQANKTSSTITIHSPTPSTIPTYKPAPTHNTSYPEKSNATYWHLSNGTLTIDGEGRMPDYTTEVAPWRIDDEEGLQIKSINIESGVTHIGTQAFQVCTKATNAHVPDSVTSIGRHAFYWCTDLQEVHMPVSLQELGECSFDHCTSLKYFIVPDGISTIKNATFNCCSSMEWVYIPKTVTSIEDSAFNGCWALKTVYYGGNISDWNNVRLAGYNKPLKTVSIQFDSQMP